MKNLTLLVLGLVAFSGCVDGNSATTQDLADGNLDATFWMAWPNANEIRVELTRPSNGSLDTTSNCVRVHGDTTVTANGVSGTLVNEGGVHFDEDSCEAAELHVPFDPALGVVELVVDDGTAQLHFKLVQDSSFKYQVTRCEAKACDVY